jgi:uncharacterized protein (DUF1697 family)
VRTAAFLRAVNVGGNNLVPMAELRSRMERAGLRNARTFLASGNATFDSRRSPDAAARELEKLLRAWLGLDVAVMTRGVERLHEVLRADPLAAWRHGAGAKLYVAFLATAPSGSASLPLAFGKGGMELVGLDGLEAFVVARPGAVAGKLPNATLEKVLGTAATMRNWNTLERIVSAEKTLAATA